MARPRIADTSRGPCPCGSGRPFAACCGPLLAGEVLPATAEALMRSRYSAYTRGDARWLLETWHPATRPAEIDIDPALRWLGLKVLRAERGGPDDTHGSVEFIARYKAAGRAYRLHETSRFSRVAGRWVYVDADPADALTAHDPGGKTG